MIWFVELLLFFVVDVDRVFSICCIHSRCQPLHLELILGCLGDLYAYESCCVFKRSVCQPSSKNIVEYSVVIELLWDAISHGIWSLEVCIESQLVVLQLNGMYHIRDSNLLRIFLWVRFLDWQFENITYIHIPRIYNHVDDTYANYVLIWHLIHRKWSIHITFTHVNIINQSL